MSIHAYYKSAMLMPRAASIIMACAVVALGFALMMQFVFGVQPCVLCLWQRVPYGVVFFTGLAALLWRPYGRQTKLLLILCAAAFLTDTGLAFFHTGVERQWWLGTSGCTIQSLEGATPADLRESLLRTVVARCDEISWSLFGLSMANFNIAYSLAAGLFTLKASLNVKAGK